MEIQFNVDKGTRTASNACGGLFFMVFALCFGGFGYFGMYGFWKQGEIIGVLFAAVFALVGTGFFALAVYSLTRKNRTIPHSDSGFMDNVITTMPLPQLTVPMTTSQGYYAVSPRSSHKSQFVGSAFVALFWNGFVWGVMILGGERNFILYIFAVIGLALAAMAVYAGVRWFMVGETRLETNRYPAAPGDTLDVRLVQPGRFAIDELVMQLVCEEKAEYRVGTDTKTKSEVVRTVEICQLTRLAARDTLTLAHQAVRIPADAMASFKSPNNEINWMVRVKMVLPRRPDVTQDFVIPVVPEELRNLTRGVIS